MRQLFLLILVVFLVVAAAAILGPGLPEGNPIRDFGESVRQFGDSMGRGFGGGYQPVTP